MKRRDFLIRSAIGSSFAANRLLGATVSRPPKREFSAARTARSGDGGLVTPLLFFSRADIPQLRRDVKGVKQTLWERIRLTLDDEVRLAKDAEVTWLFHFEEDVRVEGDLITITNGPVSLNARVLSPVPIQISIERDYPVPFVSIKTKNPGKLLALTLQGEIQG